MTREVEEKVKISRLAKTLTQSRAREGEGDIKIEISGIEHKSYIDCYSGPNSVEKLTPTLIRFHFGAQSGN